MKRYRRAGWRSSPANSRRPTACAAISLLKWQSIKRRSPEYGMSLIRTSTARFASGGDGKGSIPGRLGGCRRRNARPHCAQQHGRARGIPDLAFSGPWTSPPAGDPQVAMADTQDSSPEAAEIFRLHPLADPVPTVAAEAAIDDAEPVPLPPRRPKTAALGPRGPDACSAQPLIANPSFAQRLRDKALLAYCRAVPALL